MSSLWVHCAGLFLGACFLIGLSAPNSIAQQNSDANKERDAAVRLIRENKYPEAIQALRKYLGEASHQNDALGWYYYGTALSVNHEFGAAKDALKKSIKLNSKYDPAHSTYATVLYTLGKIREAENEVNESLKLNPSNSDALYLRAILWLNKGEYNKGLSDIEQTIRLAPALASPYLIKAELIMGKVLSAGDPHSAKFSVAWKQGFVQAAALIEKYLQLNPNASEAAFWRERAMALSLYGGKDNPIACEPATAVMRPEITYKEPAHYTDEARNNRINGTIRLRAVFDVDSEVKYILPLNFLPSGLTSEAIRAVKKIRFKPALKNGKAVCTFMELEYSFNLL